MDIAVQSDGKVVGVGRKLDGSQSVLTVFRLDPDGSLDATFGTQGIFTGPVIDANVERPRILRTSEGRFRVTTTSLDPGTSKHRCQVPGLTSAGALDPTFGNGGVAGVESSSTSPVTCGPLVQQAGGGFLVAGGKDTLGRLVRLVASGAPDGSFAAPSVATDMTNVTALGVAGDGSLLVAGRGPTGVAGALVVRLLADGQLDTLFGNDGSTWIDLPFDTGTFPMLHDITVLADAAPCWLVEPPNTASRNRSLHACSAPVVETGLASSASSGLQLQRPSRARTRSSPCAAWAVTPARSASPSKRGPDLHPTRCRRPREWITRQSPVVSRGLTARPPTSRSSCRSPRARPSRERSTSRSSS